MAHPPLPLALEKLWPTNLQTARLATVARPAEGGNCQPRLAGRNWSLLGMQTRTSQLDEGAKSPQFGLVLIESVDAQILPVATVLTAA